MKSKFKEAQGLNKVAEFHDTFDLPIANHPVIPTKERCELRVNLLQEELDELKDAILKNDLTEVADAFSDIQYVLSGAILEFGMGKNFEGLFSEVHRSNMSKVCKTKQEAEETQDYYKKTKKTNSFITKKNGEYLVYRAEDQKVLKSIRYSPANIKLFL